MILCLITLAGNEGVVSSPDDLLVSVILGDEFVVSQTLDQLKQIPKDILALGLEKLEESGLTLDDAQALHIEIIADLAAINGRWPHRPGLKLRYFLDGKDRPDGTYRVRVLGPPEQGAFGSVPKGPKYLQPAKTPVALYMPTTVDWEKFEEDRTAPLIITEGEIKAACATKYGVVTVGIGGVCSWARSDLGQPLLPELHAMLSPERPVYIAFDSDADANLDVSRALERLQDEIGALGIEAKRIVLEGREDRKVGLDDYLVGLPEDLREEALHDLMETALPNPIIAKLIEYNDRYTVVSNPPCVYDLRTRRPVAIEKFGKIHSNEWAQDIVVVGKKRKLNKVQICPLWFEWPSRRSVDTIAYDPACTSGIHDNVVNSWPGWGVDPAAGDVSPWTGLLDHLFLGATESRRWFECWCLYPIAHPGVKLPTAALLWSEMTGTGKSLVARTLGTVYGRNYTMITERELNSSFNGWLVDKQFVLADDISGHESRTKADILKTVITANTVTANIKGIPTYTLNQCCQVMLTSNQAHALYLENSDRRYFVHEVCSGRPSREFFDHYIDEWLATTGPAAMLQYARDFDYSGFEPMAEPPVTDSKLDMCETSKSEFEAWLSAIKRDDQYPLCSGTTKMSRDIYSSFELIAIFDGIRHGPAVNGAYARRFLRTTYGQPRRVRIDGLDQECYIVHRPSLWATATDEDVIQHVVDGRRAESRGGKM